MNIWNDIKKKAGGISLADQAVVGGFTLTFNGVLPVVGGYEWSYTIVNDGTEKDLSNWVLELVNCGIYTEEVACSPAPCGWHEQSCADGPDTCQSFFGIKFDDLPPDQRTQTFSIVLPVEAVPIEGCFYLKNGTSTSCGRITVPDCQDDPPCPPCPEDSMRDGKIFTYQAELPEIDCFTRYCNNLPDMVICLSGVVLERNICDQLVEITLCPESPSQQTLQCKLPLDYWLLSGELKIVWQFSCEFIDGCETDPVMLQTIGVSDVPVDEICYYCRGEAPDIVPKDLCDWFVIEPLSFDSTGLLTYRVTFTGCGTSSAQ